MFTSCLKQPASFIADLWRQGVRSLIRRSTTGVVFPLYWEQHKTKYNYSFLFDMELYNYFCNVKWLCARFLCKTSRSGEGEMREEIDPFIHCLKNRINIYNLATGNTATSIFGGRALQAILDGCVKPRPLIIQWIRGGNWLSFIILYKQWPSFTKCVRGYLHNAKDSVNLFTILKASVYSAKHWWVTWVPEQTLVIEGPCVWLNLILFVTQPSVPNHEVSTDVPFIKCVPGFMWFCLGSWAEKWVRIAEEGRWS